MQLKQQKELFEQHHGITESALLTFTGVEGYDVYNCSVPFIKDGKQYIYGRVEKPNEWARSRTFLFECTSKDKWERVTNSMIYPNEDPNIAFVDDKLVMGGIFVFYSKGQATGLRNMFYIGNDLEDMYYFTMGPENMKDIRLVQLPDKRIGVFSRPRSAELAEKHGHHTAIGFTVIDNIYDLSGDVIENAPYIPDIFGEDEWGGVNQAYMLDSGKIGIIGHKSYIASDHDVDNGYMAGKGKQAYITVSYVFDPEKHCMENYKIIATRACFPDFRAKKPHIIDCTFPSGILMRPDGKCDLYSGLSDAAEGRAVIDYPFEGYGKIIRQEYYSKI